MDDSLLQQIKPSVENLFEDVDSLAFLEKLSFVDYLFESSLCAEFGHEIAIIDSSEYI